MSPMIQKKSKNEGVLSYYDIHNNSQNHHNNQIIVDEILAFSEKRRNANKYEAGPISGLEQMLKIVKPDEYFGTIENKKDPQYENDPCVWWIVSRTPPCFKWKKGECESKTCGFTHANSSYITVELVSTDNMFRKMYNRNRKLKISAQNKNMKFYTNPFTSLEIPVNTELVDKKLLNIRRATVIKRTKMIEELTSIWNKSCCSQKIVLLQKNANANANTNTETTEVVIDIPVV